MIIRNATANDLTAIYTINQDNVPHVGQVDMDWFKKYLELAHHFRVVEVDQKVFGFMVAMLPTTDYKSENFLWFKKNYDSFIYVDRIAISKKHIGKGYGRFLYDDLTKSTKHTTNLITCEVNINPPNPESLAFHKKLGFKKVGNLETKNATVTVCLLEKSI